MSTTKDSIQKLHTFARDLKRIKDPKSGTRRFLAT